jgi:hypothetical protein
MGRLVRLGVMAGEDSVGLLGYLMGVRPLSTSWQ